jgi:phage terminase large subunit-like protein
LLYEKGRVLHRRRLDQLEAEMIAFSRMASETRSPCRKITKSKVASR